MTYPRYVGTLTKWFPDKGFGFLTPPETGVNTFVHARDFGAIFLQPEIGASYGFTLRPDRDSRPKACDISLVAGPEVRTEADRVFGGAA